MNTLLCNLLLVVSCLSILIAPFGCGDEPKSRTAEPATPPNTPKTTGNKAGTPKTESSDDVSFVSVDKSKRGKLEFLERSNGLPKGNFAAVGMGDVDKDGKMEIVSGRIEEEEGVALFSFRDGKWTSQNLTSRGEYGGVAMADMDGDGTVDVVAVKTNARGATDGVEVILLASKEGKIKVKAIMTPFTSKACGDVAVGDIEGDGDMDIATATRGDGVKVLINEGKAKSFRVIALKTKNYEDTGVAMGDCNGDGLLDVIATNHPGNNPRLFLCQKGDSISFDEGHREGLDTGSGIGYRICIGQLNDDKAADIIVGTARGLKLFMGNGCKGPADSWWKASSFADGGWNTRQGVLGDINLDEKVDVVYASESGILVQLKQGKGQFTKWTNKGLVSRGEFSGVFMADWDNDGDLDIACSSLKGLGVRFFENRTISK